MSDRLIVFNKRLRDDGNRIPALALSSLSAVDDRVRGLKAGGDDYLVKPFAFDELIARVEALLRRPNQMVTRAMLLKDVWNYNFTPNTNLVNLHIGTLRRKIDAPGRVSLIESADGGIRSEPDRQVHPGRDGSAHA